MEQVRKQIEKLVAEWFVFVESHNPVSFDWDAELRRFTDRIDNEYGENYGEAVLYQIEKEADSRYPECA